MPQVHRLKIWPPFFDAIQTGEKSFEIRENDRGFQQGDYLVLEEWRPPHLDPERSPQVQAMMPDSRYTGRKLTKRVSYVLSGMGLREGFVCMALAAGTATLPEALRTG